MSVFVCLLLCALLGAVCNGSLVKRESPPEPQSPCYIKNTWYPHGSLTGDLCDRCRCSNGLQICFRSACYDAEGKLVPTPTR
ncbi:hypothetical protein BsWGS_18907 [Bradybaena similaris]